MLAYLQNTRERSYYLKTTELDYLKKNVRKKIGQIYGTQNRTEENPPHTQESFTVLEKNRKENKCYQRERP